MYVDLGESEQSEEMILKVKSWSSMRNCHMCETPNGRVIAVDLEVDATLDKRITKPESLIGREVRVEYVHPYEYIAHNVKLLKKDNAGSRN